MKTKLLLAIAILTPAFAFVACGGSNSDNNTGFPTCTYNSFGQPTGACANQFGVGFNSNMIGYYSENAYTQTMNFNDPNIPGTSATVSNLSSNARREFLRRSMGVCDQQAMNGGSSGGYAGCESWITGGMAMTLQFADPASTNPKLTFKAFPFMSYYYNYSYQFPSFRNLMAGLFGIPVFSSAGITRNPLQVTNTVMNKAQYGFELRAYSTNGNMAWANPQMLQVFLYGQPGAAMIPYAIAYVDPSTNSNQPFATGILRRCAEANCIQGIPW